MVSAKIEGRVKGSFEDRLELLSLELGSGGLGLKVSFEPAVQDCPLVKKFFGSRLGLRGWGRM